MYLNIKQIVDYSQVSERQLRNYLKKLRTLHPSLVSGGRKGNQGEYRFNSLLQHFLPITQTVNRISVDLTTLNNLNWRWFGCIRPVQNLSEVDLINLIPIDEFHLVLFSIHSDIVTDNNHIHYISTSRNPPTWKRPIKSNNHLVKFKSNLTKKCIDYFLNTEIRTNQRTVEYGVLLKSKIENKRIILRL